MLLSALALMTAQNPHCESQSDFGSFSQSGTGVGVGAEVLLNTPFDCSWMNADELPLRDWMLTTPQTEMSTTISPALQHETVEVASAGSNIEASEEKPQRNITSPCKRPKLAAPIEGLAGTFGCFKNLAELSFGAMAQMNACTGTMIWCNKSFS